MIGHRRAVSLNFGLDNVTGCTRLKENGKTGVEDGERRS